MIYFKTVFVCSTIIPGASIIVSAKPSYRSADEAVPLAYISAAETVLFCKIGLAPFYQVTASSSRTPNATAIYAGLIYRVAVVAGVAFGKIENILEVVLGAGINLFKRDYFFAVAEETTRYDFFVFAVFVFFTYYAFSYFCCFASAAITYFKALVGFALIFPITIVCVYIFNL